MLGEHLTRASVAAAIAYAIVFVDHVPLTQAEVAACFRVSVPALRGQFKALRARVDLSPGDARVRDRTAALRRTREARRPARPARR